MTAKQVKEKVDAILENGVNTKESYLEAVPAIFEMDEAIKSAKEWVAKLVELRETLSEKAATYAIDHVTALDEPLAEVKTGIQSGTVDIDGETYRLTISNGDAKRISGGSFTQKFLAGLPDGWTKTKLALVQSALSGATAEDLAKHDMYRPVKRVWSIPEAV